MTNAQKAMTKTDLASDQPVLSVLVVSYNTRPLTLKALRTFTENADVPYELLVVDNASTDGSADAIESEFPEARLIRLDSNQGFAAANNLAARQARGSLLLLLNPDTETLPGAIDHLLALRMETPDAGIWGGKTLYADGTVNPSSCWNQQSLWSLVVQATGLSSLRRWSQPLNPERVLNLDSGSKREVDIVSGCFLLIERRLFEELGGFAPRFFMYGEDADLCLRARRLGARPVVSGDVVIIHHGGASETVRADKLIRLLAAKATLIELHFRPAHRRIGHWLLAAWPWSRMAAHRLRGVAGSSDAREKARIWNAVWARRPEWWHGFKREEIA